ncbi:Gfo/Idh/MocA family protein [Gryllotalpicola ginsengisoli]|uniref:Gfo/Idh/MocA family protein n=1 Tax=Gryllotalpicola ginsengisoli TaxID=444608 RepID=UPI0003B73DCD|nr:Gfo/Idh/MocA family oxidoreductase [Gryllotalpicola ginsengisoli]
MSPATDPPTVGLVGAGTMAREHLPHLRALGAPVLAWSRSGVAGLGDVEAAGSFDELLARCQVIDVTTPTPTHLDLGLAALASGRHVICEKPLARTDADAAALVAAAEAAGRMLLPAHVVRYFPAYARAKAAVDSGALGRLRRLRFLRSGAHPVQPWFADEAQSGGVIFDLMIHDLDQARWLAGEVVRVEAVARHGAAGGRPTQAASVTLTHANGAVTHAEGVWGEQGVPFTTGFELEGERGALAHSSADDPPPETPPAKNAYFAQLRDFVSAITDATTPRVTARDGLAAVRLASAALEAARTGRPVELE